MRQRRDVRGAAVVGTFPHGASAIHFAGAVLIEHGDDMARFRSSWLSEGSFALVLCKAEQTEPSEKVIAELNAV